MKKEKNNKKVVKKALNEAMLSSYEEMGFTTPKRRVVRAYAVIGDEKLTGIGNLGTGGTFFKEKITAEAYMSTSRLPHRIIPVTISYQVPSKPKKK